MPLNPDRRRFIRAGARLTILLKDVATGKAWRVLTKNLSGGGLCVITDGLLMAGSAMEVELTLPDRDAPLVLSAEVSWSKIVAAARRSYESPRAESGLKFMQIDPKTRALLEQYAKLSAPPPAE
ncbi:MAG: PilZ domain-containing protein [Candidatus Omnitrophica bacterium]|nr:PilZ domain-containing protein [Candidatus Omnitrophota bacterium]